MYIVLNEYNIKNFLYTVYRSIAILKIFWLYLDFNLCN